MTKRMAATGVAVLAVGLGACGGDDARGSTQGVLVAAAEPVVQPLVQPETARVDVTTSPATESVSYADAEAVFRKGRYEEAARLFGVVVESRPADAFSHYMHGLSAWKSGDHGTAEEALTRAVELDGESVKIRTNLGRVLLERGRAQEALPPLARAVELNPGSPVFQNNLGVALERSGELGGAEHAFEAALRADSSYTRAQTSLERVRTRMGDAPRTRPDLGELARRFVEEMQSWLGEEGHDC